VFFLLFIFIVLLFYIDWTTLCAAGDGDDLPLMVEATQNDKGELLVSPVQQQLFGMHDIQMV